MKPMLISYRRPFSRSRPTHMEAPLAIDALERMRAEKVALRLDQICRKALGPVPVEVRDCRCQGRHRHPGGDGGRHHIAQSRLIVLRNIAEVRVKEEVL